MRRGLPELLLALVTVLAFIGAFTDGHLQLDDWGYTLGCPFVKDGVSWSAIRAAFSDFGHGGIWMPLTFLSYAADISFFGASWRAFHAVNVALHALNAVLVFTLLKVLLAHLCGVSDRRGYMAAFAAALLWAVHPLRAEAVVWIASRKEELWTLFVLLASLTWLRFCIRGGWWNYLLTLVLFAAALLSKPTAVCFPLLAVILRMVIARSSGWKPLWYVPLWLLALPVGLIAVHAQMFPTGGASVEVFDTAFSWRALNAAVSCGLYAAHAIFPVGLHMDYRAVIGGWPLQAELGLALLAVLVLGVSLVFATVRNRVVRQSLAFAVAWALVSLLPVLGLIGFTGDKAFADRYTYLPGVAVAVPLALAIAVVTSRRARWMVGGVAVVVFIGELAAAQPVIRSFQNDHTAYSRVLACDPEHWRALRIIGCARCALDNRMDEGIALVRRSLRLRPSQVTASRLAYLLACRGGRGDFDEVRRLGAAVTANPRCDREGMMSEALAIAAFREGDDSAAVRFFSAALTNPNRSYGNLHAILYLGQALGNLHRTDEAVKLLKKLDHVRDVNLRQRAQATRTAIERGSQERFKWE